MVFPWFSHQITTKKQRVTAGTQRLSMDHRPSDPAEARRVREEGAVGADFGFR